MTIITPGSSATINALTAESTLLQLIPLVIAAQSDNAKNPSGRSVVTSSIDLADGTISGTYTILATQSLNNSGQIVVQADSQFNNVTFSSGSGGTFKSSSIESFLMEVLQFLQIREKDTTKNPDGSNNITGSYNSDTGIYSGSYLLPISVTITQQILQIAAIEYLS